MWSTKKIQGGTKHDITLRMSNKFPWEVATLTLHKWGNLEERLPFRVETRLGSKEWIEYPDGCEIHAETGPYTYTSVRAQFCKTYFRQKIQFSMQVDDKKGHTSVAIVVVKHKRRNPSCSTLIDRFSDERACMRVELIISSLSNYRKVESRSSHYKTARACQIWLVLNNFAKQQYHQPGIGVFF